MSWSTTVEVIRRSQRSGLTRRLRVLAGNLAGRPLMERLDLEFECVNGFPDIDETRRRPAPWRISRLRAMG